MPDKPIALVTGASQGIGKAIAKALAVDAECVVLVSRRMEALEAVKAEVEAEGGKAHCAACDVGDSGAVTAAVEKIQKDLGPVTWLVNNAGMTRDGLLLRMGDDDWDAVIRTNLSGSFYMTRACLRAMMKARTGRIVNVTSVIGLMGNPGQANYAASKAGLIGFTKSMAKEVASRGITVNAVAPGYIETAMTEAIDEKAKDMLKGAIPAGRLGRPEDVAAAVRFLCSDEAAYITGHVLNVGGGMNM